MRKTWIQCAIGLVLSVLSCAVFAATQITSVTVQKTEATTQVAIALNATPAKYHVFALSKPDRLVIDFTNTVLRQPVPSASDFAGTPIQNMRAGIQAQTNLRLVVDVNQVTPYRVHVVRDAKHPQLLLVFSNSSAPLPADSVVVSTEASKPAPKPAVVNPPKTTAVARPAQKVETPNTLAHQPSAVISPVVTKQAVSASVPASPPAIEKTAAVASTVSTPPPPPAIPAANEAKPSTMEDSATSALKLFHELLTPGVKALPQKGRDIIVVIDPGHGGKDPGTTGINGTREKNVVLEIAKCLQTDINAQPGFKALLTRSTDKYIGLRHRLAIARHDKADLFIAIHADAFKDPTAQGVSIFALSLKGASSEAALWLAEKENESELMGGVQLSDESSILRSVLISLSQNATIRMSLDAGHSILNQVGKVAKLHHDHHVDQAAFVVLKSPDIPSLLIETGFLSNPTDEDKLNNPVYRQKLSAAITAGIVDYFQKNPPRGTKLAYARQGI